jgi:hypothetical protein
MLSIGDSCVNIHSLYFSTLPPPRLRYVYALYWATATIGTVGYGDVHAVSVAEKILSIFVILMGEP